MSRLSDLVNGAILANTAEDGTINVTGALHSIKPALDDECREVLVNEALSIRVTTAAKSAKSTLRGIAAKANFELPFKGLHHAYPLDLNGRLIKRTEALSRAEFESVISIREKQIINDMGHLEKLRSAHAAMLPVWEQNPDWIVQQCVEALLQADGIAA
ncbi:hypothetical protein [Blastomonas sp. CCH2-A2]|uniref:hypothetical protein n=1 Tax=Blastomonas sp. CCH2-A2 TaxID=1768788 RepID=UPI0012E3DCD1|nr:hypothetical protein [Blastomonas sp. CCH2-A2]